MRPILSRLLNEFNSTVAIGIRTLLKHTFTAVFLKKDALKLFAEVEKVKTFTQADFLGPKNLHKKCVIRDKFNATQSARFTTNSIPKRLKTQGNSVKHKETG